MDPTDQPWQPDSIRHRVLRDEKSRSLHVSDSTDPTTGPPMRNTPGLVAYGFSEIQQHRRQGNLISADMANDWSSKIAIAK